MTFSPLTAREFVSSKHSDRKSGRGVQRLIIHHTAGGTNEGNEARLAYADDDVSATYVMRTDGSLTGIVPEEFRPWTTGANDGGYPADDNSVTVETVNEPGAGFQNDWAVTPQSLEGLAQLAADLSNRYGWGPLVVGSNIRGHRDFRATACPGDFLYGNFENIANRANQILGGAAPATEPPAPIPAPAPPVPSGDKLWQNYPVPDLIAQGSGQYFGSISGPAESHGGYYESERGIIQVLQQRLIACGFVPNISDPNSDWADGIFDTPGDEPGTGETSQAVRRFQDVHMVGQTQFPGQCWWDDWTKLFSI